MAFMNLALPSVEDNDSRFAWGGLHTPAEMFEINGGPDSGVRAQLEREKARLKLLHDVAKQAVSNQEPGDVVRAVITSIRNSVLCDGVCVFLELLHGGELQVYALDFPGEAAFQEGATVPLFDTIAGHVVQTARPWSGSREEACARFPRQLLLPPGFTTGCMLPISCHDHVVGTLGLARRENKSFSEEEIGFLAQLSNQIAIGVENARSFQQIRELKQKLAHESGDHATIKLDCAAIRKGLLAMFEEIVGTSPALQTVLSRISKVAPSDSTVLITGETGTGKELVARAIHRGSLRSGRAFISVNCAAIPHDLIASELFGHEKGAFTGAMQRRLGRFELADGGTIFLDEVGELSQDSQVALLRVLQEREFERVGGGHPIRVDVRVIAATNRDLQAAVANGTFRQDLFYRLNVFPIEVPPLRERKDDILMLVQYFAQRYASTAGRNIHSIDKNTLDVLQSYDWPGNIRELQNVIERSIILNSGDVFFVDESWLSKETLQPPARVEATAPLKGEVQPRSELEIIEAALAKSRGRVSGPSGAAAKLRIPPSTLDHRIKALKINKSQFKSA